MINELAFSVDTFFLAEDDCCLRSITNLKLGDKIFGPTGKVLTVAGLRMSEAPVYRINYNDSWYSVTGDHVLNLMSGRAGLKHPITGTDLKLGEAFNISVEDYLNQDPDFRRGVYGYHSTLSFPYVNPVVMPFEYGVIMSHKPYMDGLMASRGKTDMKIPRSYLRNSTEIRKLFLAGYIDGSRGLYEEGRLKLRVENDSFRNDLMFLVKSLGLTAYCTDDKVLEVLGKLGGLETEIVKMEDEPSEIYYPIYIEPSGSTDTVELDVKEDGEKLVMLGDFSVVHV